MAPWRVAWLLCIAMHAAATGDTALASAGLQASPTFNCTIGNSSEWSANKKLWCYEHFEEQLRYMEHDCAADFEDWEEKWSGEKKLWCCENVERGCPDAPATTPAPYDCSEGFFTFEVAWNSTKRDWCCLNTGRGCPEDSNATTSLEAGASEVKGDQGVQDTFDCSDGDNSDLWSVGQRAWCCAKQSLGCDEPAEASTPFDCSAGFNNWDAGWSDEKKDWCCEHERRGCEVSEPYDCNAGFNNWKAGWSEEKKEWCCDFQAVGCKDLSYGSSVSHDADDQHANSTTSTTAVSATTTLAFDCDRDVARWQKAWTTGKKAWCCIHAAVGCPPGTTTTATGTTTSTTTSTIAPDVSPAKASLELSPDPISPASPGGCGKMCKYEGVVAACALRIRFAASHKFAESASPCEDARSSVLDLCPGCSGCTAEAASCTPPGTGLGRGPGIQATSTLNTSTLPVINIEQYADQRPTSAMVGDPEDPHDVNTTTANDTAGYETAGTKIAGNETTANETSTNETATNETTAIETAANDTVANQTAANKTAANKTAANETVANETANSETATNETAENETAANETAHNGTTASETADSVTAANETAANQTAANETAASETAANETAASETAANETAASETAANETAANETAANETAANGAAANGTAENGTAENETAAPSPSSTGISTRKEKITAPKLVLDWHAPGDMDSANIGSSTIASAGADMDAESMDTGAEVLNSTASNASTGGATTTSLDFDCSAGYAHWELGWSLLKRRWCCDRWMVACEGDTPEQATTSLLEGPPQPFNCTAGFRNWDTGWSEGKKSWCCLNEGRGCPSTTTSWTYNCSAGLANWQLEWADSKKKFCCGHEGLGCEQKPVSLALVEQKQLQTGGAVAEQLRRAPAPEAEGAAGLRRLQGGSRLSILIVVGSLIFTAAITIGRQFTSTRGTSETIVAPWDSTRSLLAATPKDPATLSASDSDCGSDSDEFSAPSESALQVVARQIAMSRPVAGSRGPLRGAGRSYARLNSEEQP